jgi:hypothetical protein
VFTGDILVKQLTPDHVRMYIANLSDGPSEGEEHIRTVIDHYTLIHDWSRWLYAQKFVTLRENDFVKPPRRLTGRFIIMTVRTAGMGDSVTAFGACNHHHHAARGGLFLSAIRHVKLAILGL